MFFAFGTIKIYQLNLKISIYPYRENELNLQHRTSSKWRYSLITFVIQTSRVDKTDFWNYFWKYRQPFQKWWAENIDENARKTTIKVEKRKSCKKKVMITVKYHHIFSFTHITNKYETLTRRGLAEADLFGPVRAWLFYVCAHTRLGHCVYYKGGDLQPPTYFSPLTQVHNEVRVCLCAHVFRCMHHEKVRYLYNITLRISDNV